MTAALTPLPVLGVPVESQGAVGPDSLYSIVQMPAGVPVGTPGDRQGRGDQRRRCWRRRSWRWTTRRSRRGLRPGARRRPTRSPKRSRGDRPEPPRPVTLRPATPSAFSAAANWAGCWRWPRRGWACSAHIFCPEPDSPAFDVAAARDPRRVRRRRGAGAVRRSRRCRHLRIRERAGAHRAIAGRATARCGPARPLLDAAQDRLAEKDF